MELDVFFLTLGALFVAGLAADEIGRRTRLPRVTLLLACGIIAGEAGLDLLPDAAQLWYEFLSVMALTMVAFLLGGSLTRKTLREHGREIMAISLTIVLGTLGLVAAGLWAIGVDPALALILGAIATATAPAATQDVLRQARAHGPFADTVRGIVAIDDAWGLIVFGVVLAVVGGMNGAGMDGVLTGAARDLLGAVLLGAVIGVPAAFLTGRLSKGEPSQAEALGVVFLCAGAAVWLEVSFLITGMTAGAIVVNTARHHLRPFHEIEHVQWPFMILFFILAGAALRPGELAELGLVGAGYVVLRIVARIAGGWLGAVLAGSPRPMRPWYGMALLPQAGVAVGMALVAHEQLPGIGQAVLTLTIASTVVFEVLGPFAAYVALRRVSPPGGTAPR